MKPSIIAPAIQLGSLTGLLVIHFLNDRLVGNHGRIFPLILGISFLVLGLISSWMTSRSGSPNRGFYGACLSIILFLLYFTTPMPMH
jgi:hypothetical protein